MRGSSLRVVARIKAKPDKVEEVRELLSGLVGPTRGERGCVAYELLQNREDPTDFTFVEEWESDAALASHAASDHLRIVGAKLKDFVTEVPDVRTYSVVA